MTNEHPTIRWGDCPIESSEDEFGRRGVKNKRGLEVQPIPPRLASDDAPLSEFASPNRLDLGATRFWREGLAPS